MKDRLNTLVRRAREEIGLLGFVSAALLAASAAFHLSVVEPMTERNRDLESALARHTRTAAPGQASAVGDKLSTLYKFLERSEAPTDWLAKLYGIGTATGVELQSATYRTQQAGGRVERYEIVLPVSGSYAQIRDFLKRSLAEIPVLSLDQISLKRENNKEGAVQAELRLTLHLVKS
jgi:Tfp pilus assembly protein PilO